MSLLNIALRHKAFFILSFTLSTKYVFQTIRYKCEKKIRNNFADRPSYHRSVLARGGHQLANLGLLTEKVKRKEKNRY